MKKLYIAGGHKCGSTTTFDTVSTSPLVAAPHTKEPHGLSSAEMKRRLPFALSATQYEDMYKGVGNALALDASVMYSHPREVEHVADVVAGRAEDPFVVICLRNPVVRAYSAWIEAFRDSPGESLEFSNAIETDLAGGRAESAANTEYLLPGCLSQAIEQFRSSGIPTTWLFLEDISRDGPKAVEGALVDLGLGEVAASLEDGTAHSNPGGQLWSSDRIASLAGSPVAHRLAGLGRSMLPDSVYRVMKNQIANRLSTKADPMATSEWDRLVGYYDREIAQLSTMTGRDLSYWRKPPAR